jgi:hypothetical protein
VRAKEPTPAQAQLDKVSFDAQLDLLRLFLGHREEIVARIEGLLHAQRKPLQYQQDLPLLSRLFEECFFTLAHATTEQASLRRQLDEAHWASGFKPHTTPEHRQDLIDPAEMMRRAFHLWQRIRWPGHDGRTRYAQTLFNVYLLRRLMLLSMRIWDAEPPAASGRLAQVQSMLDELRATTPQNQPAFVRDARWLFPLAQSPTTDALHGYFDVAQRITETLPPEHRIATCKASVRMAGGHLRSQLRHVSTQKGASLDDRQLVLSTRRSNALDLATLIQALVPLLERYERAVHDGEREARCELADAILQGISPDPELFLNRLDLLRPYSMIEHLFIDTDANGRAAYTPMGQRHLRLLAEYAERIHRMSKPLNEDCSRFRPVAGAYSPYGLLYGYSSQLLEHMALKATQPDAATHFSLEDAFVAGDAEKLAWINGWRKLPHVPHEVLKLFEYPQEFAADVFRRMELALQKRAAAGETDVARKGRLLVLPAAAAESHPEASTMPELPTHYCTSSDRQAVAAGKALASEESALLHSRNEGEFIVSCKTTGGWVAVTKDVLTDVVGAGRDAKIVGLPREAAIVLKLMCPAFVILP